MTYDDEEATAVMEQDRADERRRDAQDALRAGREQDALFCGYCGEQIDEEPCEDSQEIEHHACHSQQENADTLRKALASVSSDIAGEVGNYNWERIYGSAAGAPDKDGASVRATAEAVTLLIDKGLTVGTLYELLHKLWDIERAKIASDPRTAQHTVGYGHPVLYQVMTAAAALEQVKS